CDHARQDDERLSFLLAGFEPCRTTPGEKLDAANARNIWGRHMSDQQESQLSAEDAELQREIREGRKFSLEEAIARLVGPGAMKGESPVARMQQAEMEIGSWLRTHLTDASGALEVALHREVKGSELLLNNFDQPLIVLAAYCQ